MDYKEKIETKSPVDNPIELTLPSDHPVTPVPDPAQLPAASPATFSITLPPSIMEFVSVAPTVLGKPGILWFDIYANSVALVAAGEHIGFSHHTRIHAPENATSFGLSAGHLVSVVKYSRKAFGDNSLTITVDPPAKHVVVTPNAAALTGGTPLEALLIDLSGVASLDDIDIEAQARVAGRRLPAWQFTGFFERPEPPIQPTATSGAPVPFDHRTLQRCLADAHKILPPGKSKRRLLQLDGGYFYAGNDDVIFRYDLSSSSHLSCAVAPKQLAPLADLLGLLPTGAQSCLIEDGSARLIRNGHTTIVLPAVGNPHPSDLPAIFAKTPPTSFQVNAGVWQDILERLAKGEAGSGEFVLFHGTLVPGTPTLLETESLNPLTGGQFNWGGEIQVGSDQPVAAISFLADLRTMQRAAARLVGDLTILIGPKSLHTIGTLRGSRPVQRSGKLWAEQAVPRAQLRKQIRRLARELNL